MNENKDQEKIIQIRSKILNTLNEVSNLKKYNYHIANNVSENNLDDYVLETEKNINKLEDELKIFYHKLSTIAIIIKENINQ